jgi:hypothetical protein
MGHQSYFVLTSDEDGISVNMVSKATLEKCLKQKAFGENVEFLDHVPSIDKGCWDQRDGEHKILIIKGEVVIPKVVGRVTEYEVE